MNTTKELEDYQYYLVNFLKNKFCEPYKINKKEVSRNIYAKASHIGPSTLTRIKEGNGYDLPLSTIYKFCKFENISVADLLFEFEQHLKEKETIKKLD